MKEEFFEIKLPGDFSRDIARARDIADQEYIKRLKKRYKQDDISLYKVDTLKEFIKLLDIVKKKHGDILTPSVARHIVKKLDLKKDMTPELAIHVANMKDSDIQKIIDDL